MSEQASGVAAVADTLARAHSIGIVGHVGPDGDALGSMIAFARAARAAGKVAVASFDEPFVVPDELSFLDQSVLVAPGDFPDDLDVAVAVDTSARERVGGLVDRMESAGTLVVVDHHLSDGDWGDVTLIDKTAAATTELVYDVITVLGWPIDEHVATALYVGLVTDTGRFQYSNTSPRTHRIAAELLAAGVRSDAVGQKLFEEAPFGYYGVVSDVLGRAVLDTERRLVWSSVSDEDLDRHGVGFHEVDGLIDLVRLARGTEVACLLKVKEHGVVKGSLRSRGLIDVASIAASFGGGGHHNAAGFTAHGDPAAIIDRIASLLS